MTQARFAGGWRRLISELGVIVGGILIAFAVDATWDRQQARSEVRTSLGAARSDLAANQAQLREFWLLWDEQVVVSSITLLALAYDVAIDVAPPPGPDRRAWIVPARDQVAAGMRATALTEGRRVVVPDSLLGQVLMTPTFDPSIPGVAALLDSGLLGLVEDQDLVRALADLPGELTDLADEEEQARSHVQSHLAPALSIENDLAHVLPFVFWGALTFGPGEDAGRDARNAGSTEIRVSRHLVNELATRVKRAYAVIGTVREVDRALVALVEMIDGELGGAAS